MNWHKPTIKQIIAKFNKKKRNRFQKFINPEETNLVFIHFAAFSNCSMIYLKNIDL